MEFEHPRIRAQREKREHLLAGIQFSENLSRQEMADKYRREGEAKAKALCPSSLDSLDYDDTNPAYYILSYLSGQK
ncbi:MAG: hypothetical protein UR39_C0002G0138 [Candidatus Woesebacteria bacterium GW2011_GWA1_33_30]|uniref:Uncharacterized protein n=1 Tax=Candidatus Woesebacteria bacterium GW2011_GWA2_33_28 TaxID=1618561 RepID=A0A0G0CA20_9BACT|nr:MAG: hypothetical protein UR38_C0002G0138 [Candidatus Woesebacteria bacterium GW2011_GWA2_33_28]KKP48848.1 MAG: hypothetical protein UR39_C0002G0138 [Candidatus Woesebacteria bacterium GW2011_GWA1_33_30]KKP50121.1 MAG: hypothetical protein UR40_C0002G0138 [Microgenomates group bacterium GW2011_GWC1_33_32]KKP51891.1 MAG: hypothetical protein UR44_C0006G0137 [Candidatus Woesebacteria bacterium GW2011_GWB1_33_38]KKP57390.1 MAG: hypothetical protein UR48_C0018G0008 [Microgenomates group bacteriu